MLTSPMPCAEVLPVQENLDDFLRSMPGNLAE